MIKWMAGLMAVAVAGGAVWLLAGRGAPPEAPFARVARERLVSTLATNGKADPLEWAKVVAQRAGALRRLAVELGGRVSRGDVLAEIDTGSARADLAAAEARITQAKVELETIRRGGRQADRADLDGQIAAARLDLQQAEHDAAALSRLAKKNAATRQEAGDAAARVEKTRVRIAALEARRAALVTSGDRTLAEARLRDAQAAAEAARKTLEMGLVRAPMAGVVYRVAVRPGAWLSPGDEIAQIGNIDKLRILVYVDEPELGRVAKGMPVTVTWDALPGREWKGTVDRTPSQITALGTREVGEVQCIIDNPDHDLPPGANINASVLSRVVGNALVIPKEALRRESGQTGVWTLEADRVAWRAVETGVSSVTRVEVVKGLKEGDAVALASDVPLRAGLQVRPAFR